MSLFVGKRILILTYDGERHVGVLKSISAERDWVVLENVKVFSADQLQPKLLAEERLSSDAIRDLEVLAPTNENSSELNESGNQPLTETRQVDEDDFVTRTQILGSNEEKVPQKYEKAYDRQNSFFDNLSERAPRKRAHWKPSNRREDDHQGNRQGHRQSSRQYNRQGSHSDNRQDNRQEGKGQSEGDQKPRRSRRRRRADS